MTEKKKSIFKRWWLVVISVIVIGVVMTSCGSGDDQPAAATSASNSPAPESPQPSKEPEKPKNKPTISKAEFDQIKSGMSYEEVVQIVGSEGELLSEVGSPGDQFYTAMYMWEGEGSLGANANVTFQGGKVTAKAQFGLK